MRVDQDHLGRAARLLREQRRQQLRQIARAAFSTGMTTETEGRGAGAVMVGDPGLLPARRHLVDVARQRHDAEQVAGGPELARR